jgi:hypothetical protein
VPGHPSAGVATAGDGSCDVMVSVGCSDVGFVGVGSLLSSSEHEESVNITMPANNKNP